MRSRFMWATTVALVFIPLALTSLCYASPPDQTWIGGLYDDADHDDIVLEILDTSAVPSVVVTHVLAPDSIRATFSVTPPAAPRPLGLTALFDRSPPLV